MNARKGFTLIELLVVVMIIAMVAVLVVPFAMRNMADRHLQAAARDLHGSLEQARSKAMGDRSFAGIRLVPDDKVPLARTAQMTIDDEGMLVYDKIVPLYQPPDYSEGAVSYFPGPLPNDVVVPPGRLILEQAVYDEHPFSDQVGNHPHGRRMEPLYWWGNVRVGDVVVIMDQRYTVCGPCVVGPAEGNAECFVNIGPQSTPSPLVRHYTDYNFNGNLPVQFLYLTNQQDDDGDGFTDEGWDGIDNDLDGFTDEDDEWEAESYTGAAAGGFKGVPYRIIRRPMPKGDIVQLPVDSVIEATTWGRDEPLRSRLPVDLYTGFCDVMIDSFGGVSPSTLYGVPFQRPLGQRFYHFWISNRTALKDYATLTDPSYVGSGNGVLVSIDVKNGVIRSGPADMADPAGSILKQETQ
jgi:prepilin-type N-terminal cleavage/methylation domain-containing protein